VRVSSCSLVSACLVFAAPLTAGLATAYQDDTHFYLENDVLRIAVLKTTGSLDGIVHKQSGVDLQSMNVNNYQAMWGMSLNTSSGVIPFVGNVNTTSFAGTVATSANGASLGLTWQGLRPNGALALPGVTVKAQISMRTDSELSYWAFEVDGLGTNSVISINYPFIPGIGPLSQGGDGDVLLTTEFKGMLYHNPTSTVPAGSYPGGSYPSATGLMQLLAFLDETSGFYFATDDVQGNKKDYYWGKSSSPAGDYTINVVYYPDGQPADTVSLPYNAIVGATQGDWYAAADMYRAWAVQQSWTQQSRTKNIPAWLHDLPLIRNTCAHGCGSGQPTQTYAQVVQDWQQSQQSLGVAALGELWGWEKYGAWAYGDYLPPQEGWSDFDAMVQGNPSGKLHVTPSALYLDTSTSLYASGAMASSAMLDQQGDPRTQPGVAALPGDTWAFMDVSTEPWQQYIVGVYQTLAQNGVDLIQFDSSMEAGPQPCYNPAHAHPPGDGGNWQTVAWIDLAQSAATAVTAVNPNATLSAEEPAEVYLPYFAVHHGSAVDQFEDQFSTAPTREPVPLFQYVYHSSILFKDFFAPPNLDGSFFDLALARDLTWGQIPNYQVPVGYQDALESSAEAYLKRAIAARTTYAEKFLVDGIMLPAPQLSVPTTPVSWINFSQNNTRVTGQFPSVQESAWQASDGSIGIVLTNIAPNSVTFSLSISYSRLELPPGAAYTVQAVGGSSTTTVLDPNLTQDSAYSITLTSQQILLVTLSPKALQPQISAGGVVLHASSSTTVSPGSLLDIYGANLAASPVSAPANSAVLPSILGNVQALINGIPAPLLYANSNLIIAQVPSSVLLGAASVVVLSGGAASEAASITVQQAAPSILIYGTNRAVVENQDYSVNSSANPAESGSYASVYLMGSGPVAPTLDDGTLAGASPLSKETLTTTVIVGGMPAQVLFAGMTPGLVGLVQVDFQVPNLPPGDYPIQVSIGTTQSNTAIMTVGP
jgi:uncharacterized protein (TIGR03437 family)